MIAPEGVVGDIHPGAAELGFPAKSVGLVGHVNHENDSDGIESYATPVMRAAFVMRCISNEP